MKKPSILLDLNLAVRAPSGYTHRCFICPAPLSIVAPFHQHPETKDRGQAIVARKPGKAHRISVFPFDTLKEGLPVCIQQGDAVDGFELELA